MQLHMNQTRTGLALVFVLMLAAATFASVYLFTSTGLSAQDQQFVHCYEEVRHADGSTGYLGHPPMEEKFQPDAGDAHVKTHCFTAWADAASFVTGGAVKLPADATQKDYEQATLEYSTKVYQEQLKAQQQ